MSQIQSRRGPSRLLRVGVALAILSVAGVVGSSLWKARVEREAVEAGWAAVQAAMDRRDFRSAEAFLRKTVKDRPGDGRALATLGTLLAGSGRREEAEATLARVPTDDPARGRAQAIRGDLAIDRHDAAEAETFLKEAVASDPKADGPRRRLIFLYSLQGRTAEARALLWELYRASENPLALLDLVLSTWAAENDTRGLIEQLEPFVTATPDDPWLRRMWGLALLQTGRAAEARPHLEAAYKAFEDDPVGRFALAECLMALGEPPPKTDFLGEAPADPAGKSLWRTLRARLREAAGEDDEAKTELELAIEANPNNREARFRLGQFLNRRGATTEGRRQLDLAEEIRRKEGLARREHERVRGAGFDRDAFERLAKLCLDVGLVAEGRAWLELALKADPGRATAREALAALSGKPDSFPYAPARPRSAKGGAAPASAEAGGARRNETGVVAFEDVAAKVGLTFSYDSGAKGDLFIGDTMGGGVALLDYDGDGRIDVYFINGCRLPYDPESPPAPNKLFRNRPDGTFEDVTEKAKVGGRGYGMGAAVGDYDGDGLADLFVTGLGSTVLYRNKGDGTFEDMTTQAGVASTRWTTAAAFADLDGDGDLDLVAATYVTADPTRVFPCLDHSSRPIHCSPGRFAAETDHLWRNDGNGRFIDVAKEAGFDRPDGRGLGLAVADFDEDGRLDVFVANDASPNFYFHNLGNLKFEEIGDSAGLALDGQGKATASMGVVADDLDGDGRIDVFHTNFINEPNTFRRNLGGGFFADATLAANLDAAGRSRTGFGAAALDADGDGRLDLFVSDGHVDDQPWIDTPMAQEAQLYLAFAPGRFRLSGGEGFPYLARKLVGRGVAMGDLNNDGGVDLVVVHRDAPASLLLNKRPPKHWLAVEVEGRDAAGAKVVVREGNRARTRFLAEGTSYLSVHDRRIFFALGSEKVDAVEVARVSGRKTILKDVRANQTLRIKD